MKSSRRSISEESQLTRSCNRQQEGKQIHETKAVRRQLFLHRFPSTVSRRTSRPENAYEHSSRKTLADLFPSTSLALWKFFSLGENTRILDSRHFCTTCATIASNEKKPTLSTLIHSLDCIPPVASNHSYFSRFRKVSQSERVRIAESFR